MTGHTLVKKPRRRFNGLKCANMTQNFAAVVAGNAHRRNLCCLLAHIQIGGMLYFNTAIRQEDGALGIAREFLKKLLPDLDDVMGLSAGLGDAAPDLHILRFTNCASEGKAAQSMTRGARPGHELSLIHI